jgi:glycosyltransferase involved in cell wall biosynthesis
MPTHNRSKLLDRAIKSVLAQTFTDYELVIVDDCSTDDTQQVVSDIKDSRIHYIKTESNSGGSMLPRKIGNGYSDSKYIAVLDDDDYWVDKSKLALQVAYLESHDECVMVGTNAVITNGDKSKEVFYHYPNSYIEIKNRLLMYNCFYHASVMYRRDVFNIIGQYHIMGSGKYANFSNDYELWLRMGQAGEIVNLPIYGVGRIYNSPRLNISEQIYYMMQQIKIISRYKDYYSRYWLAIMFKISASITRVLICFLIENGWREKS